MKDKTLRNPQRLVRGQPRSSICTGCPSSSAASARRASEGPTLYPVACSPQAWASASVFYLLQACLGLSFHSEAPRILFQHPVLPDYLERMRIQNLCVGDAMVELSFDATSTV